MRILAVGIATLDIINQVETYPGEDDEVRAISQHLVRGGNATNTLVVLSQLGHDCHWAGVIADEPDSGLILEDLERHHINHGCCRHHAGGKAPTSYVTLSARTGSRTIVHYRDLPEFNAEDFSRIDLSGFDWVHFEGREPVQLMRMLAWLRAEAPGLRCSLEIETPRPGIEELIPLPDLLLLSRVYARSQGCESASALFDRLSPMAEMPLFCAWGEEGAWLRQPGVAEDLHQPASVPARVVDTLGAGDVFNAGVIHGMISDRDPAEVLKMAVGLAGRKCAQQGLDGLVVAGVD